MHDAEEEARIAKPPRRLAERTLVSLARKLKGDSTFSFDPSLTVTDIMGFALRRGVMAVRGVQLALQARSWVFPVFVGRGVRVTGKRHLHLSAGVTIDDYCRLDCVGKHGITLGRGATLRRGAHIEVTSVMRQIGEGAVIGDRVGISEGCFIGAKGLVRIGDDTVIGPGSYIVAENHVFTSQETTIQSQGVTRSGIEIGPDCWLGAGAIVLDGVSIGEGAVVGAGSVVNRNLGSFTVAVGVPARALRGR